MTMYIVYVTIYMFYLGAMLWNSLPVTVRHCDDIDSFKLEITKIIV